MNKEEPYRDQAERLKQRIQKINENNELDDQNDQLPPREVIHRNKKKKTKWKLKFPVIRLLVLCFILLPIIILSVISYLNNGKHTQRIEKTSGNPVGYEAVNYENQKNNNGSTINQTEETKEPTEPTEPTVSTEQTQGQSELGDPKDTNEEPKSDSGQLDTSKQPNKNTIVPSSSSNASKNISNNQNSNKNRPPKTEPAKSSTNKPAKTSKIIYHKVQPHDTLYRLAKKYYQSAKGIEIIKQANNLKSNQINVGQVLKIPINQ